MKVKILRSAAGKNFAYKAGETLDLPRREARGLTRAGIGKLLKEDLPKQRPVTVGKVRAETRPIRKKTR